MKTSNLTQTIDRALSEGHVKNFIDSKEAAQIVEAVEKGGVSADERAQLEKLQANWTYWADDTFGGKPEFKEPTVSYGGGALIQQVLNGTSTLTVDKAIDKALKLGGPGNFITGAEAKAIVAAAKRDGNINVLEKAALEQLRMGWTYYDDKAFGETKPFESPTLSMNAGLAIQEALRETEQ